MLLIYLLQNLEMGIRIYMPACSSETKCWPQEEAKNQWNFSPIFLEGNHQHKLSSLAGQTIVCSILHLTLGSSESGSW